MRSRYALQIASRYIPPPVTVTRPLPPLAWYGIGSIACAAVSPMIATVMLGRELTIPEVDRMALSCFLGPVGWLLGPGAVSGRGRSSPRPRPRTIRRRKHPRQARGRHIDFPPRGVTAFVPNEILLEVETGTPAQYLNVVARRLQVTPLETLNFATTGRTLRRMRIIGGNTVRNTLHRHAALRPSFGRAGESLLSGTHNRNQRRRNLRRRPLTPNNTSFPNCIWWKPTASPAATM